tara:strand:+ start:463 stop:1116 length:654 start_codon:yes stop_codon:yes gene_type:complete
LIELSEYEEMYLKRMFEFFDSKPGAILKTTQLAELMGVSPASVTEMIQRLASRDLVTHIPYKGSRLTPDGFHQAARVKRRECLLEILLSEVIGYTGDLEEAACKMEHDMGPDLEAAIDKMLGYPETTPSGKKIPIIERSVEVSHEGLLLPISIIPVGTDSIVEIIALEPVERKTLEGLGISIGSVIRKNESETLCDGKRIEMSKSISGKILARVRRE